MWKLLKISSTNDESVSDIVVRIGLSKEQAKDLETFMNKRNTDPKFTFRAVKKDHKPYVSGLVPRKQRGF